MKASIVIACWNEECYIEACLNSIVSQDSDEAYEIIVVDDGSNDSTTTIVERFPVTLLRAPRLGQIKAKQLGCASAKGDIILVLDADCRPDKDWLKTALCIMDGDMGISAVTGRYRYTEPMPSWAEIYNRTVHSAFIRWITSPRNMSFPFVFGGNVVFRSADFRAFGGYAAITSCAETEIGISSKLNKLGKIVIAHELEVDSSSRRFNKGVLRFFFSYKLYDYIALYIYEKYLAGKFFTRKALDVRHPG